MGGISPPESPNFTEGQDGGPDLFQPLAAVSEGSAHEAEATTTDRKEDVPEQCRRCRSTTNTSNYYKYYTQPLTFHLLVSYVWNGGSVDS